jgi:PPK2 family polyphosphate:nucleotide phosphotransferase
MKKYIVRPGKKVKLHQWNPNDTGNFPDNDEGKESAKAQTQKILSKLDDLQELLYASGSRALLIVLQAMDTGGKDGTISHVMSGVNPQGCKVASFKVPTPLERTHDFLWRVHREVPPKGYIGIFNRSHYEDVLVTRVHGLIDRKVQEKRFGEINHFEQMLNEDGTAVLKFFLHISKEEQRQRLLARAKDPKKHWKFSINDVKERKYWDSYQNAFEETLRATSTSHAPWIVVPANHKWFRNYLVGKFVVNALEEMKLKYPPPPAGIDFKKIQIR